MNAPKFVSPTMEWLYAENPDWASNEEALYKYGFSKRSLVDVYGFDTFGFDANGRDRLGCTIEDYDDPEILKIAKLVGSRMSLSQRLHTPLTRALKMRPVFEEVCREAWDIETGWLYGHSNFPKDGKKRLYVDVGTDLFIGVHWFDLLDQKDSFCLIKTDVVAAAFANNPDEDISYRIVSVSQASDYEITEQLGSVADIAELRPLLKQHTADHMASVHSWAIYIQESSDGPYFAALSNAELSDADGDLYAATVKAETKAHALAIVRDKARTSAVSEMASLGLQVLDGLESTITSSYGPSASPAP